MVIAAACQGTNVSLHLQGIYEDKELDDESTHKKFLLVRQEGKRQVKREIEHYNLDVIIDMPGDRRKETEAADFRFSILIFGELAPIPGCLAP